MLTVRRIGKHLGAEISGVDLRQYSIIYKATEDIENAVKGLQYSDWGLVLDLGQNSFEGPPDVVLNDPRIRIWRSPA